MTSSYTNFPEKPEEGKQIFDDNYDETGRSWTWTDGAWKLDTITIVDYNSGPPGATGPQGLPGITGATGEGATGLQGATGPSSRGATGVRGKTGDKGATGPRGRRGIAICESVGVVPTYGERGALYIDGLNQIFVTVKESDS